MCANCTLFATFCSMGSLVRRKKTYRCIARKVMDFRQVLADILVYESNRKAMNRNLSNQKANPALKTKTGNK